ncbi:DNA gyrase inhibitor YacG [Rhodosalinus sp.]|uniref:DNA gyrase inhibitor YacG n=1 Tax=Rhodosalinus sp. TaxID=2047741 RepID=UPI0039799285
MTCPICDKPTDPAYRPFCSKRCADVDLARWLTGRYAVPGPPLDENDAEDPADPER